MGDVLLSLGARAAPGPRARLPEKSCLASPLLGLLALRCRSWTELSGLPVDLLLTILTTTRPGRSSCTDSPSRTLTLHTMHPSHESSVHDPFHGSTTARLVYVTLRDRGLTWEGADMDAVPPDLPGHEAQSSSSAMRLRATSLQGAREFGQPGFEAGR